MRKNLFLLMCITGISMWLHTSCSDDDVKGGSYNSGQPVVFSDFYPDSGGIATQVILTGSNFGNDPSIIDVWFNQKKAAVVGVNDTIMYVITPRMPGDESVLSVKIGTDSVALQNKAFRYTTSYSVATVAGKEAQKDLVMGTVAESQVGNVNQVGIDSDGYVYVSTVGGSNENVCLLISEEEDKVMQLFTDADGQKIRVPTWIKEREMMIVASDYGRIYWEVYPGNDFNYKKRMFAGENVVSSWKYGMAYNAADDKLYTRSYAGELISINIDTREAELLDQLGTGSDCCVIFDPVYPNLLYVSMRARNSIWVYDLNKRGQEDAFELLAGFNGTSGFQDGLLLEARFNNPLQLAIDADRRLYVADAGNHAIRIISLEEGLVSTLAGISGESGYQDGTPLESKFKNPTGVAVSEDGDVYVADCDNCCVRKISIQ